MHSHIEMICANRRNGREQGWRRLIQVLATGVALAACWTAAACTPVTTNLYPDPASPSSGWTYDGLNKPLYGWTLLWGSAAAPANVIYEDCMDGTHYELDLQPDLTPTGEIIDGAEVYIANSGTDARLGIQFRAAGRVGSGDWGSDINVKSGQANRIQTASVDGKMEIRIWYRYIALVDLSGAPSFEAVPHRWRFEKPGGEQQGSKITQRHSKNAYTPPEPAHCRFRSVAPPSSVPLPLTTVQMLKSPGDSGPAASFHWDWSCNSDDTMVYPKIIYTAGTPTVGLGHGQMAVKSEPGAAEGVILEVRRSNSSSGTKTPVEFGKAYSGSNWYGNEYLDVRYVRTADTLKTGPANGSMLISLTNY
ncbi:hypothetical protein STENOSP10_25440 [Stenotrophomonas sepilia]|uniref:Fimbrial protein n=1 Tax=Stenotrophomonas sepilia TaxID=2860290 RepID=A0ABQ6QDQ2_9GAMM|nr:hypothetical protein STENOSP10_25440 [Stenotrophomonas sepilia]